MPSHIRRMKKGKLANALVHLSLILRVVIVVSTPGLSTDTFISPCGFLADYIESSPQTGQPSVPFSSPTIKLNNPPSILQSPPNIPPSSSSLYNPPPIQSTSVIPPAALSPPQKAPLTASPTSKPPTLLPSQSLPGIPPSSSPKVFPPLGLCPPPAKPPSVPPFLSPPDSPPLHPSSLPPKNIPPPSVNIPNIQPSTSSIHPPTPVSNSPAVKPPSVPLVLSSPVAASPAKPPTTPPAAILPSARSPPVIAPPGLSPPATAPLSKPPIVPPAQIPSVTIPPAKPPILPPVLNAAPPGLSPPAIAPPQKPPSIPTILSPPTTMPPSLPPVLNPAPPAKPPILPPVLNPTPPVKPPLLPPVLSSPPTALGKPPTLPPVPNLSTQPPSPISNIPRSTTLLSAPPTPVPPTAPLPLATRNIPPPNSIPPPKNSLPMTRKLLSTKPPPINVSNTLNTISNYQGPAPQFWSYPTTWPGGVVPGVGNMTGVNATIPCGQYVILDLPNITVGLLRVQGLLQFLDNPSVPLIYVKANFVIVEGQLFIGSESQQYRQKAVIELTPNIVHNRSAFAYTGPAAPADPVNPRILGHKAFAVVGGQVQLHGLPGPSSMPVWARLGQDAKTGDKKIQVAADLGGSWPVGAQIVITSSDYDRNQAETFTIVNVTSTGTGQSIIALSGSLGYDHYGTFDGISDGFGGFVDERAEVILISRNIRITGTDEPAPHQLEGGHFMIFMTPNPPQYIEGVEFYKMGQQGQLGRYPLHLHILGASPLTVIRKNAIHQSKQRCIVNHASHNITFDSNVAYNTSGHCFMLEEGGEQNNTWVNNIGVLTNAVSVLISSDETDNFPATFWITNLINSFIGNVAAGSQESGFWFELRDTVRGSSLTIPTINNTIPIFTSLVLFFNNTAHSNNAVGMRTYPHGMRPRINWNVYGTTNVMDGVKTFKNAGTGFFIHNTDSLVITNSIFADNGWSLQLHRNARLNVTNSKFIGFTSNYGNPVGCYDAVGWGYPNCQPADTHTCSLPLAHGVQGRSTGGKSKYVPSFGIVVDQGAYFDYDPYSLQNISFSNFYSDCNVFSALVTIGSGPSGYWNPGYNIQGLRFSNNSWPIWFPPRIALINSWGGPSDNTEQQMFSTIYDKDGSLSGGVPGYLVANTTQVLPPGLVGCTPHPQWNAYTCAGVCYRTVWISYYEPGFLPNLSNVNNTFGQYSFLTVTRVSDGQVLTLEGNMDDTQPVYELRNFFITLLGNQVYQIQFFPPYSNPSFLPGNITIQVADVGDCGQGFTLQFLQVPNQPWILTPTDWLFTKQCPGAVPLPQSSSFAQCGPVCINNETWLQMEISPGINSNLPKNSTSRAFPAVILVRGSSNDNGVCPNIFNCSLFPSASTWIYDDSGMERRPAFYNPILSQPMDWKNGIAPLGYAWWTNVIATTINQPNSSFRITYYYRKSFNLSHSGCYSSLYLDIISSDGFILYVNDVEALRFNLPAGPVTNKTTALTGLSFLSWKSFSIPLNSTTPYFLVDGINTVAIEEHTTQGSLSFDMRLGATKITSCLLAQAPVPEICDGLDNNLDGLVDNAPGGGLLTTSCSTACGTGIMTCMNGYYQNCTAVASTTEICDGIDNNCDGLVDNGNNQLDCATGNACWGGKCRLLLNATVPFQVWPRNSSGWSFNDSGIDLNSLAPGWKSGNSTNLWPVGPGPLGFDTRSPVPLWQNIGTKIRTFASNGKSLTAYFAKAFSLNQTQLNNVFNIDFSVRHVDGVVVYLNGVELWRDNMNWAPVLYNTGAISGVGTELLYPNCKYCRRNNSAFLNVGMNYITAELHMYAAWRQTAVFDMDLYQNTIVPCPNAPSMCVRQVQIPVLNPGSNWSYLDASLPPPSANWMSNAYNDSIWLKGIAPFGYNSGSIATIVNNGSTNGSEPVRTLYFRKWVNLSDSSCYVTLSSSLLGKDGIIFYINGVEAIRANMPLGTNVNSTTYASGSGGSWMPAVDVTGGWLLNGMNLFSAEVHRRSGSTSQAFDLNVVGMREGVTCKPDPTNAVIPWMNG